jgi:cytochrome c oxidase subunit 3
VMLRFADSAARSPFADAAARHSAGRFGMMLFLISIGVLFIATLIGLLVIRVQLAREGLWPEDLPPLPGAMWASTAILIISGVTMQGALKSIRTGRAVAARNALLATTILGLAFLGVQLGCWIAWAGVVADRWAGSEEFRLALTGFYVLSGLHGLHVIGGLIALLRTTIGAARGRYSPQEHAALQYAGWYWHFLDVVWLIIFILLMIAM